MKELMFILVLAAGLQIFPNCYLRLKGHSRTYLGDKEFVTLREGAKILH